MCCVMNCTILVVEKHEEKALMQQEAKVTAVAKAQQDAEQAQSAAEM